MVKIRKVKKKNWAKRQSCSSNPSIRSHRDAARRGFRHESQAGLSLTVEALAKHNENIDEEDIVLDDAETAGRSMATVSISVLKRFWQSPGAYHEEVSAVVTLDILTCIEYCIYMPILNRERQKINLFFPFPNCGPINACLAQKISFLCLYIVVCVEIL